MNRIYIYGVPGTGKSTLAQAVAKAIDYRLVELDEVRPIAQSKATRSQEPFLYEYTTEAWKKFGPLNYENVVEGLLSSRQAFKPFVDQNLTQCKENIVAEAVFIEPSALSILVVNSNTDLHYNNFFVHRQRGEDADLQFRAARLMQDYLIQEAMEKKLQIVENNGTIKDGVIEIITMIRSSFS